MIITNFFNICIFLLDNIDAGDKIEDENTSSIVSNFKFYNIDDTINLDVNNLENVRKNLTINCDYYSKYNNMDKKQKLYMKTNVDNVGLLNRNNHLFTNIISHLVLYKIE